MSKQCCGAFRQNVSGTVDEAHVLLTVKHINDSMDKCNHLQRVHARLTFGDGYLGFCSAHNSLLDATLALIRS